MTEPYESQAAREFRERWEAADKAAAEERKGFRKLPYDQVAEQTNAATVYGSHGQRYVQIAEPVGTRGSGPSGAQIGPYKATKANRARVLGKNNEANDGQRDNSDWIFDT